MEKDTVSLIRHLFTSPSKHFEEIGKAFGKEVAERYIEDSKDICNLPNKFENMAVLGCGAYGTAFKIDLGSKRAPTLAMKIIPYPKYGWVPLNINLKTRPENVEYIILFKIYETLLNAKIPHALTPYTSFVCSPNKNKAFDAFMREVGYEISHSGKICDIGNYDYYRVTITDYAEFGTLQNVLDKIGYEKGKPLLFQTVMIMALLNILLPSFRHNDYHTDNLLVREYTKDQYYKVDGRQYHIPSSGKIVLINDFDFSTMEGVPNAKFDRFIDKLQQEGGKHRTPYVDMHKLFNVLYSRHMEGVIKLNEATLEFAMYVVPHFLRGHSVWLNIITKQYIQVDPSKMSSSRFVRVTQEMNSNRSLTHIVTYYSLCAGESFLKPMFDHVGFKILTRIPSELIKHKYFKKFQLNPIPQVSQTPVLTVPGINIPSTSKRVQRIVTMGRIKPLSKTIGTAKRARSLSRSRSKQTPYSLNSSDFSNAGSLNVRPKFKRTPRLIGTNITRTRKKQRYI